jgi:mono/diheme cytochrome c family protein
LGLALELPGLRAGDLPIPATPSVDYHRDVQPILQSHCYPCHGPEKQKHGLRLDRKADAMQGSDAGPVIVPGKSAESKLVRLVSGSDPDQVMPPKGERLAPEQVAVLRAWIDQGAVWPESERPARSPDSGAVEGLWSLQPIREPEVPKLPDPAWARNPIDNFILAALAEKGLALSSEVDRRTLIRRLKYDLHGLPPTPVEIEAFVHNPAPDAYERLVDQLLAAPEYGERWGRHWLDVARYTESQGFEYDHMRENAWQYRDYVIASFNEDKPYDQFVKEQIAGDMLEPVTRQGIIATSFLVCGPWDQAGSSQANATQRLTTREEEMEDMVSVVGQTFLGLTVNCARCHSHKFDPIPQTDYYRIKSVFEGVRHGEAPILTPSELRAHDDALARLKAGITTNQARLNELESAGRKRVRLSRGPLPTAGTPVPTPVARWAFAEDPKDSVGALHGELRDGALIAEGRLHLNGTNAFVETGPLPKDIGEKTLAAWISLANLEQSGGGAISLETTDGRRFDTIVFGERWPAAWMAGSENYVRSKDLHAPFETVRQNDWVYVAIAYAADNSITVYRNGELYASPYTPESGLQTFKAGESHLLFGKRHTGGGKAFLHADLAEAALYDRALNAEEVSTVYRASPLAVRAEELNDSLTSEEKTERTELRQALDRQHAELDASPKVPVSYIGQRKQPEPTHRLKRGDVRTPLEIVTPGALSAVATLDSDFGLSADAPEAQRRIGFAQWVTDRRNPLPARVLVNRLWQYHFGRGIVATPNDFGASGARPSHPELLDWLASQLMKQHWSVKAIQRLIVCSAAYRQGSGYQPGAARVDAENQLLWRFSPHRLEAEALRDAMLSVSGQLNPVLGGPSFRPFDTKEFNATFYFPADKLGPEYDRRTVYRMNINSGKDPLLEAFDCPEPSIKTPKRGLTTTPLQALSLMNSSFVQRQARHLAERVRLEANGQDGPAIELAYRYCFGRSPAQSELQQATVVLDTAGLQTVCWALLNATEFLYVR